MFDYDEKAFCPHPYRTEGHFPPEKPRYTMTEEIEVTARELRNTIDRLLRFEERLKQQVDDICKNVTADNVIFKNTFADAHRTFLESVKNEVNVFEGNVDASMTLFKNDLESNYATLSEDVKSQISNALTTFANTLNNSKEELNLVYADFRTAMEKRFNDLASESDTAYQSFIGGVNNKLANIESNLNEDYATFINTITEFKTDIEREVASRLDSQDSTINDAVLYMKTNLAVSLENMVAEMRDNGEFDNIIDTQVFTSIAHKVSEICVVAELVDETKDQTATLQGAIDTLGAGGCLKIPSGKWRANISISRSNIKIIQDGGKDESYITPFNTAIPCVTFRNCKNVEADLTVVGKNDGSGDGVVFDGVTNFFGRLSVDGFGGNNVKFTNTSESAHNSYIFLQKLQTTGSMKSNLLVENGMSYTTAVYITELMNTVGAESTSKAIEIYNATLSVGMGWIQAGNNRGIDIHNNAHIYCGGVMIDSDSSDNTLIRQYDCDTDILHVTGDFNCDGRVLFDDKGYSVKITDRMINKELELLTSLYFLDAKRGKEDGWTKSDNFRVYRSGNTLNVVVNGHLVVIDADGRVEGLKPKAVSKSSLPTLTADDYGYQAFVKENKIPVWWNGSAWIKADGSTFTA